MKRLLDFGIIPKSKYCLDVYLEIAKLFHLGKSPDQIVQLKNQYPSLQNARISREFVKKAIKLITRVILPEMASLVPEDGNWTMMIDGTVRAKYDDVLIIIAAVPLDRALGGETPIIILFEQSCYHPRILQIFLKYCTISSQGCQVCQVYPYQLSLISD